MICVLDGNVVELIFVRRERTTLVKGVSVNAEYPISVTDDGIIILDKLVLTNAEFPIEVTDDGIT
jgi:hypothetical protein